MGNIAFDARGERLKRLTSKADCLNEETLVRVISAPQQDRMRIRMALNIYLWACLNASFEHKSFDLRDDMLEAYEQEVLSLPNVTPNGLILPKRENISAFNLLQNEVGRAFATLGLGEEIARIQYPVNVRMQNGTPDPVLDARPRASVKPHSDIWAGDPASGALVFLCVLGNPRKSGIRFFEPKAFPKSFVRTLEDYNEGLHLMEGARELPAFDDSGWFIADSYLIHQTTKQGAGARISIDFRIIPKERVASDIDEDTPKKPFFISFDEWTKLGNKTLITTKQGIRDFSAKEMKDPYTIGYPVKIGLSHAE